MSITRRTVHSVVIVGCFLVIILTITDAFSLLFARVSFGSNLIHRGRKAEKQECRLFYDQLLIRERSRNEFCLFAAPKRKDNRKYVAKPKDDEDEVDDDYFQELAEDVKELLRSARAAKTSAPVKLPDVSPVIISLPTVSAITNAAQISSDQGEIVEGDNDLDDDALDLEGIDDALELFADDSDENYVTSVDEIIDSEDSVGAISTPAPSDAWREQVQAIIHSVINKQGLYVQKIYWGGNRVEVVISATEDPSNPIGPSVTALQLCHRSMYDEFELREEELAVVTRFEIVVASPGIGEILRSDQDFVSFKGFMVAVTTTEIFRKKTVFEGTLVDRSVDTVCISLKGRPIKIPRDIISEVRLPKPKYEATDTEMRKLR